MSSVSGFNIVPNVVKPKSSPTETVQWGLSIFGNPALPNYGFYQAFKMWDMVKQPIQITGIVLLLQQIAG